MAGRRTAGAELAKIFYPVTRIQAAVAATTAIPRPRPKPGPVAPLLGPLWDVRFRSASASSSRCCWAAPQQRSMTTARLSSAAESEWKLYLALDKRDEAAHVALARFVAGFWQLHAEAHRDMDADGDGLLSKEDLERHGHSVDMEKTHKVTVQGGTSSLRLPKYITPIVANNLLMRCAKGAVLAASDLERLLRQARQLLETEPTINRIPSPEVSGMPVVIVGDLHGCISDLAQAVALGGPLGKTIFVFNGDFVDRGRHGVEVMACLCALKLAYPDTIFLNRGNHECRALSKTYGLQGEVKSKYRGPSAVRIFEGLASVFASLPLGLVVGGNEGDRVNAFVVHGGIPRDQETRIVDIQESLGVHRSGPLGQMVCKRTEMMSSVQGPDSLLDDDDDFAWALVEDLLWSDPIIEDPSGTIAFNQGRKAGCLFGLGAADDFLQQERLQTLVRSHEVVRSGLERWPCGPDTELYTVFSCSNYPDKRGINEGAVLRFGVDPSDSFDNENGLTGAEVIRWETSSWEEPKSAVDQTTSPKQVRMNSVENLSVIIASHKESILEACRHAAADERCQDKDPETGRSLVPVAIWSDAMAKWGATEGLDLPSLEWKGILPLLRKNCNAPASTVQGDLVDYEALLSSFSIHLPGETDSGVSARDIMTLYDHHEELALIFAWMDANNDGMLSFDEVQRACGVLNATTGEEQIDAKALFRAMDIDGSGTLNRHKFMESFRLTLNDSPAISSKRAL
mmetsp:Transcript_57145/g.121483  ORF Transcript_57145/g.121483 Transcript_57145/m.121483 type:complete len:740 (-) Transcript_57145:56-2275(-)